ncbi:hypothetical protein HA402_015733 [Bradysia odoriphaga]|nr:hypothetical protein HA402_015733 [Bradysia odoriphaga]
MNNCVVNSLPHYNDSYIPNGTIVIQTLWTDESIVISVYSTRGKQGYSGTLLKSKLTATAEALETDASDFMVDIKLALCTPNGLPTFTYHLTSESFKFCKVTAAGLRLTYGEVDLVEQTDAVEQILLNSIKSNEEKQIQIDTLRLEIRQLNETYDCLKSALEKCVDEKVQMENVLMTKFAALLNAKKDKIVELEKTIRNRSTIAVDDDFESDGSDSDLDYSSQSHYREKSSIVASTSSNQSPDNVSVLAAIPKRRNQGTNETIKEASGPSGNVEEAKTQSMDIYERDTEVMLCDM